MATIGRKVRVFGRVQGVFFRQWTLNRARALGISGWVRNCPDGTVEAHFFGDDDPITEMVEGMRRGPSQARVEEVEIVEIEPEDVSGFSVKH